MISSILSCYILHHVCIRVFVYVHTSVTECLTYACLCKRANVCRGCIRVALRIGGLPARRGGREVCSRRGGMEVFSRSTARRGGMLGVQCSAECLSAV